jgi:hypothetical protein
MAKKTQRPPGSKT